MKILIGGDLAPTIVNHDLFSNAMISELLGIELLELWNEFDIRVLNLETPLSDIMSPIAKSGPCLVAPESTIIGIKALKPSLICLANNHILDQGIDGLKNTIHLLSSNDIPYIGAGSNLNEASKPFILHFKKIKIGFYVCAEHEFSIASVDSPGANPFDPLESLDHIADLKNECDYVVVLYHGGKEHYRYPSPYLQKVCRKMADKGANLVICQHSHCIGCFEVYKDSTLVYGQGNFIFNKHDNEYWKTSILIAIRIDKGLDINYIPIMKNGNGVRLALGKDATDILESFYKRSCEILNEGFIEQQYQKFADENRLLYLIKLAGFGKWLSRIDRKLLNGFLAKHKYTKKQLLAVQNCIKCESHRELLLQGLFLKMQEDYKI